MCGVGAGPPRRPYTAYATGTARTPDQLQRFRLTMQSVQQYYSSLTTCCGYMML